MIQHILTILKNERKQNIPLWLELLVVSCFLWYICDTMYCTLNNYLKPKGFDVEHTYDMRLGRLPEGHRDYTTDLSITDEGDALATILERIQKNPMIEAASYSYMAQPYNGSNQTLFINRDTLKTSRKVLIRRVTPDFFKVFRYKSQSGSTDELVETVRKGEVVISTLIRDDLFPDGEDCVGKKIYLNDGDSVGYRVGAVSQDVRYDDYQTWSDYIGFSLTSEDYMGLATAIDRLEICVRVKPEYTQDFATRFRKEMSSQLRVGNFFLRTIDYMPDVRASFHQDEDNSLKEKLFVVLFLLTNILLGVTGVFWFRTQQRKAEIGLRIAVGDTPRGILRKFFLEGVLLLVLAIVPAMILFAVLFQWDMLDSYTMSLTASRYFAGLGMTFVLLLLMILFGVWFPARRSVGASPAETLRAE